MSDTSNIPGHEEVPRASTKRSTVHLLQYTTPTFEGMREALTPRYLDRPGFTVERVPIGGVEALLVYGVIDPGRPPEWTATVRALTGVRPDVANRTSSCALLVPVEDQVFALTYGMGHHLIAADYITPGFGLSFVLRAVAPDAVRQVTHTAMDARGRTDRNSVALDQNISSFGVEPYGEIVSRLVGKPKDLPLTFKDGRSRHAQITGTDSLHIHLGVQPTTLLADLAEILHVYKSDTEASEFGFIAKVRPLKNSSRHRPQLDAQLEAMLQADGTDHSIALTIPTIHLDGEDAANAYAIKIGTTRHVVRELTLDALLDAVAHVPAGERLKQLTKGTIQAFSDECASEVSSTAVRAHKWIAAETSIGSSRFFFHDGRWYEIGDRHHEILRQQVGELLAQPSTITLPDWTPNLKDEAAYNKEVQKLIPGYVCLDRDLLHTTQHPHGIEACDLLGPDDELIHVKRANSTAPLNHLFQQGRVSAEALRWDPEARAKFVAKVRAAAPNRVVPDDFAPRKVVYAISLSKRNPVTSTTLFTFAQVSLLQAATALRNTGIEVAVVNINTVK